MELFILIGVFLFFVFCLGGFEVYYVDINDLYSEVSIKKVTGNGNKLFSFISSISELDCINFNLILFFI